jgi:prepilin-type N-terminal cleavage/methylation domain-containing protein
MKSKSGFTLIELLVAIGVVGVLMGAVVAVLNPVQFFKQGRDGRRLSDLTTIQSALEQYYAENASYPDAVPGSGVWSSAGITYLKSMPQDPQGGAYSYARSGADYEICATMEDTPPSDCSHTTPLYGATGNCCLTNPF